MLGRLISAVPGRSRAFLLLMGSLSLGGGACELVLGDIPPNWQPPDGHDASDANTDSAVDSGRGFEAFDASLSDAGDDETPGHEFDASLVPDASGDANLGMPPRDASMHDANVTPLPDAAMPGDSGAPDASEPPEDAAVPCTQVTWYADDDGDGEGNSKKTTKACLKPAGKWVDHGGDCADGDARAHHGQTTYFGTGYKIADGKVSFDFDCSGQEEPWAGQPQATEPCDPILCRGSGYPKTARTGVNVHAHCGSANIVTCARPFIACEAVSTVAEQPFLCR